MPAALPHQAFFRLEQGRFGPDAPSLPCCYGFSVMAKVKPGREEAVRAYGATIEETVDQNPCMLEPLKLHYLRWILFDAGSRLHFMLQGIFDIGSDEHPEDALPLFVKTAIAAVFMNLEGWPDDWQTNPAAVAKLFRDRHCPSFLEYGEYPHVSEDEVRRALAAESPSTAEQMQ